VDLQGFTVGKRFVVKENAEKKDHCLTLHFYKPCTMESPYKIRKVLCFLVDCKLLWIAIRRPDFIQFGKMIDYNGCGWIEEDDDDDNDNEALVYVKESQKRE